MYIKEKIAKFIHKLIAQQFLVYLHMSRNETINGEEYVCIRKSNCVGWSKMQVSYAKLPDFIKETFEESADWLLEYMQKDGEDDKALEDLFKAKDNGNQGS